MYLEYIELCLLLCAADILYEILLHTMFQTIFFCNKVEQKKIGCSNLEKHSDHPELSLKTLLFPYNMKIYWTIPRELKGLKLFISLNFGIFFSSNWKPRRGKILCTILCLHWWTEFNGSINCKYHITMI